MPEIPPNADDVDHLLLNARLRDEIEPFRDDSLLLLDASRMPTAAENRFLAEMLAWERAPALPIARWFEPELTLPSAESLSPEELGETLCRTIGKLFEAHVVLEFTEHLSDLELYRLIRGSILPSYEKKLGLPETYLYWHCLDDECDEELWLSYYASDEEREEWSDAHDRPAPAKATTRFRRDMPRPR